MKNRVVKIVSAMALVITAIAMFTFAGCSSSPAPVNSETKPAAADANVNSKLVANKGEKYYMIAFASGIDFWKGCYAGAKAAAALYGAEVVFTGTSGDDANEEAKVIDQVAAMKPAGMMITVVNPDALKGPIEKAMAAGIPVICFDSDAPTSGRLSFLALDNYNAGRIAGQQLSEWIGGKGTISGSTVPGAFNLEERWRGLRDVIKEKYPDIKIVDPVNDKYDSTEGAKQVSALLQAHPEINGLFASNALSGVGVGTALQETNNVGKIKVMAFDSDNGTLDLIEKGVLTGTLVQGRFSMGYWAMQFLYAINHGLIENADKWQKSSPIPKSVDTGVSIVMQQNVANYRDHY